MGRGGSGGRGFAFNVECSSWGMVPVREADFLLFFGSKGFSVPKVAAQRRDVFSFAEFWSLGADDRCAAVASAALRGDLEMLKDICDSDDCSIGVEEANLPDVLEHWALREYVELAFLRATTGSSRHRNLQSVLLWLEERESMGAFDFAFGPMKEPELDGLRRLTLTGKIFHVFSFQDRKSQLPLIDGCYKGHQNMVSELLKVGAPDEISPLFTFRTVGIVHHPRVASWPLRALVEARVLSRTSLVVGQPKDSVLQCQRLLRQWEHDFVLSVHHSVSLFRPLHSAIPAMVLL